MRNKLITFAIAAMVAVNVGLFTTAQPAQAAFSPYSCGCVMGEEDGKEPVCISWLQQECTTEADCSCK